MSSLNKVMLIGNVGRDPEIRSMQNGGKVAQLSIATSEQWRDKSSGEKQERTEWHRVVVFNERAVNFIEQYVAKGSRLYVEGELQTRKWTDNAGSERFSTEIVVSKFRGEVLSLSGGKGRDEGSGHERSPSQGGRPPSDLDDQIPFAPEK